MFDRNDQDKEVGISRNNQILAIAYLLENMYVPSRLTNLKWMKRNRV